MSGAGLLASIYTGVAISTLALTALTHKLAHIKRLIIMMVLFAACGLLLRIAPDYFTLILACIPTWLVGFSAP